MTPVVEVAKTHGIAEQTIDLWRQRVGRLWLAADGTWYCGGAARVEDGHPPGSVNNSRLGATLSIPTGGQQSFKVLHSSGVSVHRLGPARAWRSVVGSAALTVLVALVSEVFVEAVRDAAEMASAFSGARRNRLDLSVSIALGSASHIALFVAPVLVLMPPGGM